MRLIRSILDLTISLISPASNILLQQIHALHLSVAPLRSKSRRVFSALLQPPSIVVIVGHLRVRLCIASMGKFLSTRHRDAQSCKGKGLSPRPLP